MRGPKLTLILRWGGALLLGTSALAESTRPLEPVPVQAPTAFTQPADPDHFMFAAGGDNRSAARGLAMPPTAPQVFSEFRLLRPAFSVWTGDAIYGSDDTIGEASSEYDEFQAAVAKSLTPLFNAPGNHEISERKELEALYVKRMGRLYGSFDYGHSHFIALDTEEIGRKPGIWGEQLDWLTHDLEANRNAAHTFAFSHHPLFPKIPNAGFADAANRDEVHRLFVRYKMTAVFSGHEHLYYRSVHDGITYFVTGGCGAPTASPDEGGFQHYMLIHVNGSEVTTAPVEPWRLFMQMGSVQGDGSCSAEVSNYDNQDFAVTVEFPTDALGARASAYGTFTFKGWTQPVAATIIPSLRPGYTAVRVTVPRSRLVIVGIRPAVPSH